ncbi:MAG: SDR family oxidoreductase [Bacteroidetes bacterium]|nr:SDR family oxidoreductase [Bacteroidota bacterium]
MDFFRDRSILITGASSGIGEAMARQLAPVGSHLILVARSEDKLNALAEECREQGSRADVFAHDLSHNGSAQKLYDNIAGAGHRVDVLINNAGFGKGGAFVNFPVEAYEQMITLNAASLTSLTRLCLPGMIERGSGGVLNVASVAGFMPIPYFSVYAATKAFVLSFSEALHAELKGTGVHVSCLSPGPTETGFATAADMEKVVGGPVETAEKVAALGLDALSHNKRTAISGAYNRVQALSSRFVPRKLTMAISERYMKGAEK